MFRQYFVAGCTNCSSFDSFNAVLMAPNTRICVAEGSKSAPAKFRVLGGEDCRSHHLDRVVRGS